MTDPAYEERKRWRLEVEALGAIDGIPVARYGACIAQPMFSLKRAGMEGDGSASYPIPWPGEDLDER